MPTPLPRATPAPVTPADRSVIHWRGHDLFLLGANYPYVSYANDFGSNAWGAYGVHTERTYATVDADFARMRELGLNSVRWFMFADGRSGIEYDERGIPTGIDEYVLRDLDAALEIAERHQILVTFVLLDFMFMWDARQQDGVQLGGHAQVINTPEGQRALIDNVFVPVLRHAGDHPWVLAWEVMNEPEWAIYDEGDASSEVSEPASVGTFRAFARDVTHAIHTYTASYSTIGAASAKWLRNWTGIGLDFYQVHYYDWMLDLRDHNTLGVAADSFGLGLPIVMGEFPAAHSDVSDLTTFLDHWYDDGYAGAWLWSFRGGDAHDVPDESELARWAAARSDRVLGALRDEISGPTYDWEAALRVDGNRLVKDGETVRLVGVNRSGSEFACMHGNGFFDGPIDDAAIAAMASWGINTVRVPLNERCWLGRDDVPEGHGGRIYQIAISRYVETLNAHGLFVILDLHWTGPGTSVHTAQQQMPSREHSTEFWRQVATAYMSNPLVLFDLYNEPFPDHHRESPEAWRCWSEGGPCQEINYEAASMQELIDVIRDTGARNVILVPGIRYGNSLTRWLELMPHDPLNNIAATWHSYDFNEFNTRESWEAFLLPLMEEVPLVTGEIGGAPDYVRELMAWHDAHGANYLAWSWNVWGSDFDLIVDYDGTPSEYGTIFHDHVAALPDIEAVR
jgi:hypothetical protein